jgi:hypothetical protein
MEGMWKEAVIAWFEILSRLLPVGTGMNHEKPNLNPAPV